MNMFKESLLFSPRTRLITFAVLTPIALGTGCLALEMGNPDRIERVCTTSETLFCTVFSHHDPLLPV